MTDYGFTFPRALKTLVVKASAAGESHLISFEPSQSLTYASLAAQVRSAAYPLQSLRAPLTRGSVVSRAVGPAAAGAIRCAGGRNSAGGCAQHGDNGRHEPAHLARRGVLLGAGDGVVLAVGQRGQDGAPHGHAAAGG